MEPNAPTAGAAPGARQAVVPGGAPPAATDLKDRVDPLIAERAPWVYRPGAHIRLVRGFLHLLLGYDDTIARGRRIEHLDARAMMDALADMIAHNVEADGLERVPDEGPAIIVCNHPTGIADGIVLWSILRAKRPDLFFFANRDAIRVMPQLADIIAPVEWRPEKRSHGSNRETLTYASQAFKQGRLAVLFPSGRLAKRRGLRLYEREWMPSAAMLARKYKLPVIPIHITARNSMMFYIFDALHETLRDVTLFHEVVNKSDHTFRVRAGRPLDGAALSKDSELATQEIYRATMRAAVEGGDYSVLIPKAGRGWFKRRKPLYGR
ncbi:MAG: 1-acyl-sn-glycerol-3-phosphate acyltransferase [Pseudomonadota bacterium]